MRACRAAQPAVAQPRRAPPAPARVRARPRAGAEERSPGVRGARAAAAQRAWPDACAQAGLPTAEEQADAAFADLLETSYKHGPQTGARAARSRAPGAPHAQGCALALRAAAAPPRRVRA